MVVDKGGNYLSNYNNINFQISFLFTIFSVFNCKPVRSIPSIRTTSWIMLVHSRANLFYTDQNLLYCS